MMSTRGLTVQALIGYKRMKGVWLKAYILDGDFWKR